MPAIASPFTPPPPALAAPPPAEAAVPEACAAVATFVCAIAAAALWPWKVACTWIWTLPLASGFTALAAARPAALVVIVSDCGTAGKAGVAAAKREAHDGARHRQAVLIPLTSTTGATAVFC